MYYVTFITLLLSGTAELQTELYKSKLQIGQNKLARFVLNKHHQIFPSLGWLSVCRRVRQLITNPGCQYTTWLVSSKFTLILPGDMSRIQATFYRTTIIAWNGLPVNLRTARRLGPISF